MKRIFLASLLIALIPLACSTPDVSRKPELGSIEQLRETWINRNGTIGSNVTIRVRQYRAETGTGSIRFCLNEEDLRNPCRGSAEYRLPIQRLTSSTITSNACAEDEVWELVIDTADQTFSALAQVKTQ